MSLCRTVSLHPCIVLSSLCRTVSLCPCIMWSLCRTVSLRPCIVLSLLGSWFPSSLPPFGCRGWCSGDLTALLCSLDATGRLHGQAGGVLGTRGLLWSAPALSPVLAHTVYVYLPHWLNPGPFSGSQVIVGAGVRPPGLFFLGFSNVYFLSLSLRCPPTPRSFFVVVVNLSPSCPPPQFSQFSFQPHFISTHPIWERYLSFGSVLPHGAPDSDLLFLLFNPLF